jgi:hypothetical protein
MMLPVLIESDDESYGHNNTERRENLANDIDTCSDVRGVKIIWTITQVTSLKKI